MPYRAVETKETRPAAATPTASVSNPTSAEARVKWQMSHPQAMRRHPRTVLAKRHYGLGLKADPSRTQGAT